MVPYLKAGHPDNRVIGMVVIGYIECNATGRDYRREVFQKALHVTDFKPDEWYSQDGELQALALLEEALGPKTLFLLGKAVAQNVQIPPMLTLEMFLRGVNDMYRMNVRGENLGEFVLQSYDTTRRQAEFEIKTPYPDQFNFGTLTEFCRRFKPDHLLVPTVAVDPTKPIRSEGGDSTTYLISW